MRIFSFVGRAALASTFFAVATSSPGAAQSSTVATRPTPGPAKPFVFPKITTQTLPNGLRLAVLENHELPIVAVRVGLPNGMYLDAPGKEGTWALLVNSLREGTATRSATSIAEAAADLGTPITWNAAESTLAGPSFTAGFTTVRSAWQPALELVADMLTRPSFPTDGVRRVQAGLVSAASRPTPVVVSQRILAVKLYGVDHPYTRYATDSSVRSLTRDDIVALQAAYLRPQNTTIVVAGDVTPAEARSAVEKAFSSWEKTGTTIEPIIPKPSVALMPTTIFLRDQPGATQSLIIGGQLIPSRASSDAIAIQTVAVVLGGSGGGSRLWDAFRVAQGLSYNPRSQIGWRPEPEVGTWFAAMPVPTAKTDTAAVEFLRVVRETHGDRLLTTGELDFARRNLVGGLPGQMETVDQLSSTTLGILQNRLPTTYYTDYARRQSAVTLEQAQAAAAKYLDSDHLVIVVVGDRAKIETPLRATGIPVVIVDH